MAIKISVDDLVTVNPASTLLKREAKLPATAYTAAWNSDTSDFVISEGVSLEWDAPEDGQLWLRAGGRSIPRPLKGPLYTDEKAGFVRCRRALVESNNEAGEKPSYFLAKPDGRDDERVLVKFDLRSEAGYTFWTGSCTIHLDDRKPAFVPAQGSGEVLVQFRPNTFVALLLPTGEVQIISYTEKGLDLLNRESGDANRSVLNVETAFFFRSKRFFDIVSKRLRFLNKRNINKYRSSVAWEAINLLNMLAFEGDESTSLEEDFAKQVDKQVEGLKKFLNSCDLNDRQNRLFNRAMDKLYRFSWKQQSKRAPAAPSIMSEDMASSLKKGIGGNK